MSAATPTLSNLVIASRESALALWQARNIQARLQELYPQSKITIRGMTTQGDRILDRALDKIGGKGLFVKELEDALAAGTADIAVHSVKDLPMELPRGFILAAVGERGDPRDAFVSNRYAGLAELPAGARVGTSSPRRECQLRARYPRLQIAPLRGNVPTRLKRLDEGGYDAVILAAAGLKRLGLEHRITRLLAPSDSMPAPGQGAIGIECLESRTDLTGLLAPLNHAATTRCVAAERAFSLALSGNCNLPLGAYAEMNGANLRLRGFVGTADGSRIVSGELEGPGADPQSLGSGLAQQLKARGAADILTQSQE